jgi:hypothetical protein
MTALIVVMAGLALGSDETERVLTETQQHFMCDGYWVGTWQDLKRTQKVRTLKVWGGCLNFTDQGQEFSLGFGDVWPCRWVDERSGKCKVPLLGGEFMYGIYKRENGRLIICLGKDNRPCKFKVDENSVLLILKPGKSPRK